MEFAELLGEIVQRRAEALGRMWGLLFPLAAAFVGVGTYVLFHLPAFTLDLLLATVTFAVLLFIPVDAIADVAFYPYRQPSIVIQGKERERVVARFLKLPDDKRVPRLPIIGKFVSYLIASLMSAVLGLYAGSEYPWVFILGAIAFIGGAAVVMADEQRPKRGKQPLLRRALDWTAVRVVLGILRWGSILGFGLAAMFAMSGSWIETREDAVAVAGIVAMVLLFLLMVRVCYTIAHGASLRLLNDLRYRFVVTRELDEATARACFEAIESLRWAGFGYVGNAVGFAKDMKLHAPVDADSS